MKSRSAKFKRARSSSCTSASTLCLPNRNQIFQQDIQHIAQDTIIPFVNDKFRIIPKYIRNTSKTPEKIKKTNQNKNGLKLILKIIVNRVAKVVRLKYGKKFIIQLRYRLLKQKLLFYLNKKALQLKNIAFNNIKKTNGSKKYPQKILLLHFLNKKTIFHSLSYAFRQIILFKSPRQAQQIEINSLQLSKSFLSDETDKTENKNPRWYGKNKIPQIRVFDSSQTQIKNRPLKPDTIGKIKQNFSAWTARTSSVTKQCHE